MSPVMPYRFHLASMEPRSLERGNIALAAVDPEPIVASMEPRSLERGNCTHRKFNE